MTNEIVKKENDLPELSSELMDEIGGLESYGYSEHADDSLIPILGILQDNSAEVKKKHDKYIKGAEPGMLIIRALGMVMPTEGPQSPVIQPCGYQHMWVEWQGDPGEGAVVNQHEYNRGMPNNGVPNSFNEKEDPQNPERKVWMNDEGNRLVETRYHFGHLIIGDELIPVVIPMAGTNHGISKQWTAQMKRFTFPSNGRKMPSFMRHYTMETVFTQKGNNSWYKYRITDNGVISEEPILRAGLDMFKSLEAKEISVDVKSDTSDTTTDDDIPV